MPRCILHLMAVTEPGDAVDKCWDSWKEGVNKQNGAKEAVEADGRVHKGLVTFEWRLTIFVNQSTLEVQSIMGIGPSKVLQN